MLISFGLVLMFADERDLFSVADLFYHYLFDMLTPLLRPDLQRFRVFFLDGNSLLDHGDQILGQAKSIVGALDRAFEFPDFPEGIR